MTTSARPHLVPPVSLRDHVRGPETAPVTLVEYGDYECPYCRAAVPIVEEIQQLLGDRLRFVFRHFPLSSIHPHAQKAAEAAEAAGAQGRYWKMHSSLFEHQQALDDEHLVRYAFELDIDVARFQQELETHAYAQRVFEDYQSGLDSGVEGTPTFFLDGVRYDGPVGVRELLSAIRHAHPDSIEAAVEREAARRRIPRVVTERSPLRRSAG